MSVADVLTAVLVTLGMFFFLLGSIGILRFPDFYTRLHPAGKVDTLGATLVLLGLAVHEGLDLLAVKVLLIQLFIFISNPVGSHALGRAALHAGIPFWKKGDKVS